MKKLLLIILFVISTISLKAQVTPAPGLEYVCELKVKLKPAIIVGETPHGVRRIIPITGGSFEGPKIKGEILDGGADWQIVRKDYLHQKCGNAGSHSRSCRPNRPWRKSEYLRILF
jgi:hypothetical protein